MILSKKNELPLFQQADGRPQAEGQEEPAERGHEDVVQAEHRREKDEERRHAGCFRSGGRPGEAEPEEAPLLRRAPRGTRSRPLFLP